MQAVIEHPNEKLDTPVATKLVAPSKTLSKKYLMIGIGLLLAVTLATLGSRYYSYLTAYESTDDAFIEGHVIALSPKLSGHIAKVYVNDNQEVKKGDLLVELDARDYEVQRTQAQASLASAMAKLRSAQTNVTFTQTTGNAGLEQASANINMAKSGVAAAQAQAGTAQERLNQASVQIKMAEAGVEQSQAEIRAAEAEAQRAATDAKRYQQLYQEDLVSRQVLDNAQAQAQVATAQLEAIRKKAEAMEIKVTDAQTSEKMMRESLKQAESQINEAQAQVGTATGRFNQASAAPQQVAMSRYEVENAQAEIAKWQAQVAQAELQLSYTKIYAPTDGRVTRKSVEEGAFVQIGQSLMAVVPQDMWVIANFKETQLTNMRVGQEVEIRLDAYPSNHLHGHVDSIQNGTGARFSMLPPENATGNYVKVVQRIPVKIVLDKLGDNANLLAPGMSVLPEVKVK